MKNLLRRTLKLAKPANATSSTSSTSQSEIHHQSSSGASTTATTTASFALNDTNSVAVYLPHDAFVPSPQSQSPTPLKRFNLALCGRRVQDLLCAVLDEIGLNGFAPYFVLKIIVSSTGTDLLCSFAGANRAAIVQKLFQCADCRIQAMCAVCRLVCHSGHKTKPADDELSDAPSRCFCGSGSQLRLQTGRGQACGALVANLHHVVLEPNADVLAACFENQLAGHTTRLTLDFAPGVHSSLARLVVSRRRNANKRNSGSGGDSNDDDGVAPPPISPRTPGDDARNIEVELQRAIHASAADAESESEQRRNEQVEFAALAAQSMTPSPSSSPRVRATTSPSMLDSSHSAAHGLTALLTTLWPHLTDSTSLPIGGGDQQANKSVRERTNSEAVAWLDVEYALRRLRPLPVADRRARVNTASRALAVQAALNNSGERGSLDEQSESVQPRRSPLAIDNSSVRASTQSVIDFDPDDNDADLQQQQQPLPALPSRVKPSEHIVLAKSHIAAVDDRSSSLTDNFLPEVDLDMSTVSLRHKLREGSLVRELQSLKVPSEQDSYVAQPITQQERESDVDFRESDYAIVDFGDYENDEQRVRSSYVKLTPRLAGESQPPSASSLAPSSVASTNAYAELPLPPADSSMMQLVRREMELRPDAAATSPYGRSASQQNMDELSGGAQPLPTPRRRRGAICEAQIRVDSDTGHFWAALVSSTPGAPLRLAFIPPKSRAIAKHGDWVLLEMNEARADGRQSAHVLRVVANAKGLPVVAVPPTTHVQPSAVAPHISVLALAQFEAAIESYMRELNVVHLLATVPQHRAVKAQQ